MSKGSERIAEVLNRLGPKFLPFADAATDELPLSRLLRLSLFQISVGMSAVLLSGTLNRVMIVELGIPASIVAIMVAIPLLAAPFRALIGFRSDTHRSVLGWRRVPYLWIGTMLQFGGFAILPFALIIMSGDTTGSPMVGVVAAGLGFLLVGVGMHTVQTAGLALATDLAPEESRPRVVALLYVMLLVGMVGSALLVSVLLQPFGQLRLIKVVQGAAFLILVLNFFAVWKQEPRDPSRTAPHLPRPSFGQAWRAFAADGRSLRLLVAVGLGTAGFSMQDILLEPYGGQILHLSVGATTGLTAIMAAGTLIGLALAARALATGADPIRVAALGALVGLPAFSIVVMAAPLQSALLFRVGCSLIGLGNGLFAVGMLTSAMSRGDVSAMSRGDVSAMSRGGEAARERSSAGVGLALGAFGAVQASAAGLSIAVGGLLRDGFAAFASTGALGPALTGPATAYGVVYHLEIALLFATLVAVGPLVRPFGERRAPSKFGLADVPG